MNWALDAVLLGGGFLALLCVGMWIPFAIALTAIAYLLLVSGLGSLKALGLVSWGSLNSFTLTAVPLFILMAELMLQSGLSQRIYRGLAIVVRRLPGRLLQTNILGSAVFAAISGSSVATAAAIGTVAMPQLISRGYDLRLSAGSLAAGGTLGILIPPSIAMIIYGSFTDTSVAKLFMGGVVPGIALTLIFMVYVAARTLFNPSLAPATPAGHTDVSDELERGWGAALLDLGPPSILIFGVLGALYFGWATPTEAAGVGCVLSAAICFAFGKLGWREFHASLRNTIRVTGSIMFIVYAAFLFSYAVGISGLPHDLAKAIANAGFSRIEFLLILLVLYVVMGCIVDSIGMMVITVPVLFPTLVQYQIDPIWFGVQLVLLIELGLLTPPLGLNLFVIQSITPQARLSDILLGVIPFFFLILLLVAVLAVIPELVLWLPTQVRG